HDVMRAVKAELGKEARRYNFNAYSDARAVFRYDMHTLPTEISSSIGTSTLFAAWNAAIYVAQIDDARLGDALRGPKSLDELLVVLQKHGSLWFLNESYVVSRKRDCRTDEVPHLRAGRRRLARDLAARAAPPWRGGVAAAEGHLRL